MNNQQVQDAYASVQAIFSNPSSYENLNTENVIAYLQDGVIDVGVDLQVSYSCVGTCFKCRGFKAEIKMASIAEMAESFGLNSHVSAVRNLMCVFGTEHNTQLC